MVWFDQPKNVVVVQRISLLIDSVVSKSGDWRWRNMTCVIICLKRAGCNKIFGDCFLFIEIMRLLDMREEGPGRIRGTKMEVAV